MRLFIAVEFSDAVKDAVSESAQILRRACSDGNFSHRENYHITLAFLGDVPPSRIKRIADAMDACSYPPFDITIGAPGRFRRRGGDIFWRAIEAPDTLFRLQSELSQRLEEAGFALEDREYSPHLTLARQAVLSPGVSLDSLKDKMPPITYTAGIMTLMRSERIGGKLTYTPAYKKELAF